MIRTATASDIPRVVEMGMSFYEESGYSKHLTANPEQMGKLVEKMIPSGGVLVSEYEGQLYGMLGFVVFPHFMSAEMVAGEVFYWVEPEYRGDGLKLMREAEKRARNAGAKRMQMIAPTQQVARVYERLGYDFVESSYQKSL